MKAVGRGANNELVMALPVQGNPPYSFAGEHPNKGVYKELFGRLFNETPFELSYVYLSNPRIRSNFSEEKIDVECCPIEAWRVNEQDISLYTEPLFSTRDMLVFADGQKKVVHSLSGMQVAVIAGYGYKDDHLFERLDVTSELLILKLVASGRVPVGIVDEQIANYLIKSHQLSVELGQVHEAVERPLRLHLKHKDKLAEINRAIRKVKAQGVVEKVLGDYVNQ